MRDVSAGWFSWGARHSGSTTDPMGGAADADGGMAHGSADQPTAARWGAEVSSMSAPHRWAMSASSGSTTCAQHPRREEWIRSPLRDVSGGGTDDHAEC